MNDQMQHELLSRLDALAQKLGVSANALWELSIKQQKIEGVKSAILCFVLSLTCAFTVTMVCRKAKTLDDSEEKGFLYFCGGALSVVVFVVAWGFGSDAINSLMNPSYAAFKEIVAILK